MAQHNNISREQLAQLVRDKRGYYEACVRNGFIMPSFNQRIVTLDFLNGVRAGTIYCPKVGQVADAKLCARPPTKEMLVAEIAKNVKQAFDNGLVQPGGPLDVLMEILHKKQADQWWLIKLLYCVNPNSEVFNKDYAYHKPKPPRAAAVAMIGNENGFFDGLPQLLPHQMKGRQLRLG